MDGMDVAHGDLLHGVIACCSPSRCLPSSFPETPRVGVLRIETTRGDRLVHHASWLAFINHSMAGPEVGPQPYALLVISSLTPLRFSAGCEGSAFQAAGAADKRPH
jgi:hypothetical protein